MKEATGELSNTVITVVAIAAILSLFTVFLYPSLKAAIRARTYCQSSVQCGEEFVKAKKKRMEKWNAIIIMMICL